MAQLFALLNNIVGNDNVLGTVIVIKNRCIGSAAVVQHGSSGEEAGGKCSLKGRDYGKAIADKSRTDREKEIFKPSGKILVFFSGETREKRCGDQIRNSSRKFVFLAVMEGQDGFRNGRNGLHRLDACRLAGKDVRPDYSFDLIERKSIVISRKLIPFLSCPPQSFDARNDIFPLSALVLVIAKVVNLALTRTIRNPLCTAS